LRTIMTHAALKQRHRRERDGLPANLNLRVHRALSWLDRAERQDDDPDGRFIFLWIAFNAAYATDIDERYRVPEQQTFVAFLQKLIDLDLADRRIEHVVWDEFTDSIRLLIDNRFVYQDFWSYHNGKLDEAEWTRRFVAAKRMARHALGRRDTATVLSVALSRLYTLRPRPSGATPAIQSSTPRFKVGPCPRPSRRCAGPAGCRCCTCCSAWRGSWPRTRSWGGCSGTRPT
jgi:hypothetical protein